MMQPIKGTEMNSNKGFAATIIPITGDSLAIALSDISIIVFSSEAVLGLD